MSDADLPVPGHEAFTRRLVSEGHWRIINANRTHGFLWVDRRGQWWSRRSDEQRGVESQDEAAALKRICT